MLRGEAYAHSAEKRALDYVVAGGAYPAYFLSRLIVRSYLDDPHAVVVEEKRVGKYEANFNILKLRTIDDKGYLINGSAERLRTLGLDESAQVANILNGTMSAVGHRPIMEDQYEAFMDSISTSPKLERQYRAIVMPTRPGIFSTYARNFHEGFEPTVDQCLERAESDIEDVINGSVMYDIRLIAQAVTSMVGGKFGATEVTS